VGIRLRVITGVGAGVRHRVSVGCVCISFEVELILELLSQCIEAFLVSLHGYSHTLSDEFGDCITVCF
jgi:hypothetical protein